MSIWGTGVQLIASALDAYQMETQALSERAGVTEESYYPAIKQLITVTLAAAKLPFEIRTGTSEVRSVKFNDRPDFVLADCGLVVSYGEVKTPDAELREVALSEKNDDQIGRYLARTGAVLVTNVREIALILCRPGFQRLRITRVAPADREIVRTVHLWSPMRDNHQAAKDLLEILQVTLLDTAIIGEPSTLARILALQAKAAKAALPYDLHGLETLLQDYRDALGLSFDFGDEEGREFFRSTLIQTVFYGLFSAWALWQRERDGSIFSWDRIHRYLKIPFLAGLFHEFRNPSRLRHLDLERHLDRATDTLNRVNLEIFRQRMTSSAEDGDVATRAMTYFYEPFLEAFDPDLKKSMGVWYTPPEIVRYQVRKAHALLKEQLGRPLGLADDNVVLLDPCCGTGAYLLEAARCIADELRANGDENLVGLMLLKALTSRIFGFEVLTAPFAIAQLQLYIMLSDLRAPPPNEQRLGVFLTNALTGWNDRRQLKLNFPELQQEYEAAQAVKQDAEIVVIVGNPPYDRHASVKIDEEAGLVDYYKGVTYSEKRRRDGSKELVADKASLLFRHWGVKKQLLNDLYVRFYRLAEREIGEERDFGLVSLITNSSWLTGRSHPIMRQSLLQNFHEVWIDNMNGDKYRTGKIIPKGLPNAGLADQSVFTTESDARGIQTGVAIATLLKRGAREKRPEETRVHYRDFWGKASTKRVELLSQNNSPAYSLLRPNKQNRWRLTPHTEVAGYEAWPSIEEIFPKRIQGINPNRGIAGSIIDTSKTELATRISQYFAADSFERAASLCPTLAMPRANYKPEKTWENLKRAGFDNEKLKPYLLFPFDQRWIYYEDRHNLLNRPREEMGLHLKSECFLVAVPEPRKASEARPLFSKTLLDLHVHDRGSVAIPAILSELALDSGPIANLSPDVWSNLRSHWDLRGGIESSDARTCAQKLIYICLAVMNAPSYREEHASSLNADWARIPIPCEIDAANCVAEVGAQVASLMDCSNDATVVLREVLGIDRISRIAIPTHVAGLPIAAKDLEVTVSYFGASTGRFEKQNDKEGKLWINDKVYLANVPTVAWETEFGGYQTVRKWLGYRHLPRNANNPMTLAEQRSLRDIILRLTAISALEPQLDELYSRISSASIQMMERNAAIQAAE